MRWGNSEGSSADAGPCKCRDDVGRVRRFVRLRPHIGCRECGQNVGTAGATAQKFDTKTRSTSHYARRRVEPPVRIELTTARLPKRSFRELPPDMAMRPRQLAPPPARVGTQLRLHRFVVGSSWLIQPAPAALAQLVERRSCKADVESSSLSRGSIRATFLSALRDSVGLCH